MPTVHIIHPTTFVLIYSLKYSMNYEEKLPFKAVSGNGSLL